MRNEGERRHAPRAPAMGTALLQLDDESASGYEVANLSAGGALLTGGPSVPVGRAVRVVLQLGEREPLSVGARVLRHQVGGLDGVAVGFAELEPHVEDQIQDRVMAVLGEGPDTRSDEIECEPLGQRDPPSDGGIAQL